MTEPEEITVRQAPPFQPMLYETDEWAGLHVVPTPDFVFEVRRVLADLGGDADRLAQQIVDWIEEHGAQTAMPMFDLEGAGPLCSWCRSYTGICKHGC